MTQLEQIERLFFEARRSAFGISFLCFIGTAISLVGLSMLDPALGILIPALIVMVLVLFTLMFLLLAFRLFQPIGEIVIMVNKLYDGIMRDELGVEPARAETEKQPKTKRRTHGMSKIRKQQLEKLTQQVSDLTKEVAVLKKGQVSSAKERDWFWPRLILGWLFSIMLVLGITLIITNIFNSLFAVVGVVGITIIALAHAYNKGRLKGLRGDKK